MKFDPTATGDKGGEAAATQAGIAVLQAVAGEPLVVADGAWLLSSQFARQGSDLLLTGADGSQVLIRDYFRLQTPPDLMTAGGALVRADLAVKLAGPLAPGQYAQTTAGESTEPIGRVESVDGTVEVVRTDGTRETLSEGDPIFQGDVLETSADGTIGIVFVDDTTFSLAENGRMTLDEFVYDPGGEEGTFKASLVQGVFSFVSGEVAKLGPGAAAAGDPHSRPDRRLLRLGARRLAAGAAVGRPRRRRHRRRRRRRSTKETTTPPPATCPWSSNPRKRSSRPRPQLCRRPGRRFSTSSTVRHQNLWDA